MKDLAIVAATTVIIVLIWTGVETAQVAQQSFVPQDLLEISTQINGRMDAEYLDQLTR